MTDTCERPEDAARRFAQGYQRACETIAVMHAAAVGITCGPIRGVVEDVEDVRLRAERAEATIARVRALHFCNDAERRLGCPYCDARAMVDRALDPDGERTAHDNGEIGS